MALSIKFRGDSSSDIDAVKEVLQSLSISEEDVTIIKKAGGDIKIKATINTVKVQEFSVTSTGGPANNDDPTDTFITLSFPGSFMIQSSSTSESQLSIESDENEKSTKNIKDFSSNSELLDWLSERIYSQFTKENVGKLFIFIKHDEGKQYMQTDSGKKCESYVIQVELSGRIVTKDSSNDVYDIIYELFDHPENDKFIILKESNGTKTQYMPKEK